MKPIRKITIAVVWAVGATAGICTGANLPPPPYPVIFIHGLAADAHLWDDLAGFLTQHGWQFGGSPEFMRQNTPADDWVDGAGRGVFYTLNMSDSGSVPWKSQNLSFTQQGYEVGMVVQAVKKATGTSKVILVGHSMGGLAARAYLQGQGRWDGLRSMAYSNDVASAITIGAPHQGSPLANILVVPFPTGWLSWLNPISVAIEALETGSPALAALNSGTLPPGVNYVSIIADGVPIIGLPGQTGDGIVSGQSQDLANAVSVAGLRYLAVPLQIYPQYFWSPLETHSYEPSDYQVWDQLIRQISTPAGLPSDLLLRVTASPNPVRPGERVQLVYTISNQGSNDLPGAELRMITPSYTEWADGSDAVPLPDWWSNLASPGDERIWTLGTLPAGQSRNILVSAGVWSGSSAPTNLTTLYTAALATSSRGDSSS